MQFPDDKYDCPPIPRPALKTMAYLLMSEEGQQEYLGKIEEEGRLIEFVESLAAVANDQMRRAMKAERKLSEIMKIAK